MLQSTLSIIFFCAYFITIYRVKTQLLFLNAPDITIYGFKKYEREVNKNHITIKRKY